MTTQSVAKLLLTLNWRPLQGYDYVGQSDDGKCLLYRNTNNGQDYSICVDNNTSENWNALWQAKNAPTMLASNYHATARDYLADERAYGMGVLGLSENKSNDRAYLRLARLAKKNGIDPTAELNSDERIEYAAANKKNNEKLTSSVAIGSLSSSVFAIGSLSSSGIGTILAVTLGIPLLYIFLKDLKKDKDAVVSALVDRLRDGQPPSPQRQPVKNTFLCKNDQREELHTCDEISFSCKNTTSAAVAGGMICVRCDAAEFLCKSILPNL